MGCGSGDEDGSTSGLVDAGPKACSPGELAVNDRCQPAGLPPDMACPPGQFALDGGDCQAAGVHPLDCAQGFIANAGGCDAILPGSVCPAGQMAIPGESACRAIASCGSGTWGDITTDATTQFVDGSYPGSDSDGTKAHPWRTIAQAVTAAASGGIVAIAAGSYPEDVVIQDKSVRLWGRCPSMVEISGTGTMMATVQVSGAASSGTELHGVAVTGASQGLRVTGAGKLTVDRVWAHDNAGQGLVVDGSSSAADVAVSGSLFEANHIVAVLVSAARAELEGTVVRSTQPAPDGHFGIGVAVESDSAMGTRGNATLHACVVEANRNDGVWVSGSDATLEATVVRTTAIDGNTGRGIDVQSDDTARSNVTVRSCVVEQNASEGIEVRGSDATIEATVVRDTQSNLPELGIGIRAEEDAPTMERAKMTVRTSLIEGNHTSGVFVLSSDVTVESSLVRANEGDAMGDFGYGLYAAILNGTQERAKMVVRGCAVEENLVAGMAATAADVTIDATVVRGMRADASGHFGRGIEAHGQGSNGRTNLLVRASLIEDNEDHGVVVTGSDATIETTIVRGQSGRGIGAQADPANGGRGGLTVRACVIENNHDVGVFGADADVTIGATVIRSTGLNADHQFGWGVGVQAISDGSTATIEGCLIEDNHKEGVLIEKSDAGIDDTIVRGTQPIEDGGFGDGIAVVVGNATVRGGEITKNKRAGIASFGSSIVVTGTTIACNDFDVEGEPVGDASFSFDKSVGWQCTKQGASACTTLGDCNVRSDGLEAPTELPQPDM